MLAYTEKPLKKARGCVRPYPATQWEPRELSHPNALIAGPYPNMAANLVYHGENTKEEP